MNKVAVLMSTYNGERFLRQQIDTILDQENVAVDLYIRDDGSTDTTKDIVEEYQRNHKNIVFIKGKNAGVGNSFMKLLYSVPDRYDYYAFSDQDDIWKSDKLAKAIVAIQKSGCCLYGSNQECVDAEGNTMGLRYDDYRKINLKPFEIMCRNDIAGCTFVFTRDLYELLKERRPSNDLLKLRIHDVWVAMVASVVGEIYYDEESHMMYRQHDQNVVGAKESSKIDILKMQFNKLFDQKQRNGRSKLAKEVVSCYPEYIEDELIMTSVDPKTIVNKRILIDHRNTITQITGETKTAFISKVVLGYY